MALTTTPVFCQTPKVGVVQILPADASAQKTVVTAGANGSKVTSVTIASTDTSVRVVQLSVARSAVNYILGSVSIPANSGTDGTTASVNLLAGGASALLPGLPVDNDGQTYLFLQNGDTLQISSTTTVTAAKAINAVAVYGDF